MTAEIKVPELDMEEFLSHYGVPGMRWGKRSNKGGDSSSSGPSRKELRVMNKNARRRIATEAKEKHIKTTQANDKSILNARDRLGSEKARYNKARKQYRIDKKQIGSVAAKEILKKHENKYVSTYNKATQDTGKEATDKMIRLIGGEIGMALARSAVDASRY